MEVIRCFEMFDSSGEAGTTKRLCERIDKSTNRKSAAQYSRIRIPFFHHHIAIFNDRVEMIHAIMIDDALPRRDVED